MHHKVALYSSGMDSYALAYLWRPDTLVYFDLKTAYSPAEMSMLRSNPLDTFVRGGVMDLSDYELENGIIPSRNLLLVTLAANYAPPDASYVEVALGATAGDRVLDKSVEFADMASSLLTYLWQPQHWTAGREVEVTLPLKHLSKRQILETYVAAGGSLDLLDRNTISCYKPRLARFDWVPCCECKPCVRKWIALKALGHEPHFDAREAAIDTLLPLALSDDWDRGDEERADVLRALDVSRY